MPTIIGPSHLVANLILKGTLSGAGTLTKIISTTFNYRQSTALPAPSKLALSNAFLAGPYAALLAAFNINWSLGSTNIRFFDDVTDPSLATTLAGVGAIATDRLPSYNSVFMFLKTAFRGKRNKGSKHFPACNEVDTTQDVLVGAGLARWQTVQTAILAPLVAADGATWNPCIVSYKSSQLKTSPERVICNDIAQVVLNLDLGVMRKRKTVRQI